MPQDWLKLCQEGEHFEAQKWQNWLGIEAQKRQNWLGIGIFRLSSEKLTLCCDILAGLWAPRANPQPNPAFVRPKLPQDWPKLGQEGEHFEAQKLQN